jgi:hypothetical protein
MSNPTIAAFTTIRNASGLTPQQTPLKVKQVESIIPSPFCSPWRHPIWWWKLRHLRADTLLLESEVDPAVSARMRELEEQAFLVGTGN